MASPLPIASGDRSRRRIVQLMGVAGDTYAAKRLYALCNDNSVWLLVDKGWQRLPDIPQDDEEPS
jgi:hypothetical protein